MSRWQSLGWLIHPHDPERFLAESWEQAPFFLTRDQPDYFASLLTLDDIDRVITTLPLRDNEAGLVDASRTLQPRDYTDADGMIDAVRMYQHHADGATIILPQLHTRLERLAAFCRGMEAEFSAHFQTNIYLTPPHAKGFKSHYDNHDVFVVQVLGSKDWKIYDTPITLPFRGQRFEKEMYKPGEVTQTFTLRAGDIAYVPRGVMHDAESTDETSLHITLGVIGRTWTDLLLEALPAVALKDPEFRRTLPPGFAQPDFDRSQTQATFARLMQRIAEEATLDDVFDEFVDNFVNSRTPVLRGQMDQVNRLPDLTLETECGARPDMILRIIEKEDGIAVRSYGHEITFPAHAAGPVKFALANARYRVRDVPDDLDDDGKLVLVRRLVREGLVRQL